MRSLLIIIWCCVCNINMVVEAFPFSIRYIDESNKAPMYIDVMVIAGKRDRGQKNKIYNAMLDGYAQTVFQAKVESAHCLNEISIRKYGSMRPYNTFALSASGICSDNFFHMAIVRHADGSFGLYELIFDNKQKIKKRIRLSSTIIELAERAREITVG